MASPRQPNIVFILSDQQRWDSVGCYGQALPTTPNLDRMAAEGVRFEHAFSCQPICGPARSCLQTGKWATETGCFMNDIALPLDETTIAHRLSGAGYDVGYVGKWHLASTGERYADPDKRPGQREPFDCRNAPVPPERRGGYADWWIASDVLEFTSHGYDGHMFDADMRRVEFPEGRYRVDAVTDFALEYLRTRDGGRPFFLFLSFIEPHWQNDLSRHEAPRGAEERFADFEVPGDLREFDADVSWLPDGWRREYPRYLACVHSLDENVGRVLSELEAQCVADDTLVIYAADHGCHFGSRNHGAKDTCHDASVRVPMILRGPGFRGGGVPPEPVSLMDLPPTLMEAGGVPVPDEMGGRPLQPVAAGGAADWPAEVFFQISPVVLGRGIRTLRWTYAVRAPDRDGWDEPAAPRYVSDHLYDLECDPHQFDNLAADPAHADVRAELAGRLEARMHAAGEEDFTIEN